MVKLPPVVMLMMASQLCLIRGRNCMNTAGSGDGRPSLGSRACRCRIAAPASAASIAWVATSSGVSGRCGLIVGVWIDPVTAQVMMTFLATAAMGSPPEMSYGARIKALAPVLISPVRADEVTHLREDLLAP